MSTQDDAPVLQATGLSRSYRGRQVVSDVDLQVHAGEVVGLLGPNGAGKTTCFRLIAGLESAEQGSVCLAGRVLDGQPLWRRVRAGLGYLAQEPTVFRRLSVADNLRVALQALDEPADGAPRDTAAALLERAGLTHLASSPAGRLSGGERRRLEIARCLAARPKVLMLDEPFAGVDPVAVGALQQTIRDLAATGLAVLVTDHAVRETLGICDRAVILDLGRVMAEGSPATVAADPHVRTRYLGASFRLDGAAEEG